MDRSKFIGGSDAAGVLGMSRWDTPLSVWSEKTGNYIKPEVESEAAELGRELEEYVAKRFERKTNLKVKRVSETMFLAGHNFLGANVDRMLQDDSAGLECKTASAWKSKEWQGEEIPQEYIIQCFHYMMVTGLKKWYLAVLIGNQDFKIKELNWDQVMIDSMLKREVHFWNEYVVKNVMPGMIKRQDTDTLFGLFPEASEGKMVRLSDEANIIIENLQANKQDLKAVEGVIEENENQLKALLKDAEIGETSVYRIQWSNMRSKRWDTKALEIAHPDLVKEFKPEKLTRRFSYKPLKGE